MAQLRHWYYPQHHLVVTRLEGDIWPDELREFVRWLSQESGVAGEVVLLQDQRTARIHFTYEQFRALALYWASVRRQSVHRCATVVPDRLHFGLSRMAAVAFHPHGLEIRPFFRMEDALAWLGVPADILPPEISA